MEKIQEWMGQAALTLHPEKIRVVEMTEPGRHFDFLGYRFWRARGGGIKKLVRPKSKKKLRARSPSSMSRRVIRKSKFSLAS